MEKIFLVEFESVKLFSECAQQWIATRLEQEHMTWVESLCITALPPALLQGTGGPVNLDALIFALC